MLDTQVLVWWSTDSDRLSAKHRALIDEAEADGIATSAFSFWEIAMAVSKNRIDLGVPVGQWFDRVVAIPTLHILSVSPAVLIDSVDLPGTFHADPADRIIVATARAEASALLTTDGKILNYEHVRTIGPS